MHRCNTFLIYAQTQNCVTRGDRRCSVHRCPLASQSSRKRLRVTARKFVSFSSNPAGIQVPNSFRCLSTCPQCTSFKQRVSEWDTQRTQNYACKHARVRPGHTGRCAGLCCVCDLNWHRCICKPVFETVGCTHSAMSNLTRSKHPAPPEEADLWGRGERWRCSGPGPASTRRHL